MATKKPIPTGMIRVRPALSLALLRDPLTGRVLDPKGELKPRNAFWLRRLNDGDLVDMDAPKPEPKPS